MKYKGSMIASEIVQDWQRENYYRKLKEQKSKIKCRLDEKMQCDKCKFKDNCDYYIDREII